MTAEPQSSDVEHEVDEDSDAHVDYVLDDGLISHFDPDNDRRDDTAHDKTNDDFEDKATDEVDEAEDVVLGDPEVTAQDADIDLDPTDAPDDPDDPDDLEGEQVSADTAPAEDEEG